MLPWWLAGLQAATIPLIALGGRVPQIVMNWKRGNAGNLSLLTALMNVAGCLARAFTSVVLTQVLPSACPRVPPKPVQWLHSMYCSHVSELARPRCCEPQWLPERSIRCACTKCCREPATMKPFGLLHCNPSLSQKPQMLLSGTERVRLSLLRRLHQEHEGDAQIGSLSHPSGPCASVSSLHPIKGIVAAWHRFHNQTRVHSVRVFDLPFAADCRTCST